MKNNFKENFENMRIAGNLAANALDEVTPYVKPGAKTNDLDKICYEFIKDNNNVTRKEVNLENFVKDNLDFKRLIS